MRLLAGTSGYSYKEWKGPFYPAGVREPAMLAYYAARFPTVEINNTFYRLPREAVLRQWAAQVPAGFQFVLKASRRITHFARLKGAESELAYLLETARTLGPALGPVLFQLPPNLPLDLPRLAAFLARLPADCRAVLEFRHASWFTDEVYRALRARGAALCASDRDESEEEAPLVATADFGYLRLRRVGYGESELQAWREKVRAQPWREAYVFFKHEDEGVAPRLAAQMTAMWDAGAAPATPACPAPAAG